VAQPLRKKYPQAPKNLRAVKSPKRRQHTQTGEAGKVCKSEYHLRTAWQPGFFKTAGHLID
jgi:hypothetical protein